MFKRLFFLLAGVGLVVGAVGVGAYFWLVVMEPGQQIRESNIEKILAVESPVFYRDGQHKIGVFFEEAHRQYIPYESIPRDFVNSIVASEDQKFFSHHGFDFPGVLRAMAANIRAGRVVQGGSTITQQTAKNLFKRKDRSLFSKLKELVFALRLEAHYPKEKILEFYANQFYVSGNGRGLGVASRYYFNKDVSELDLLECAFIAGSVKRPNYYNPFIKADESDKAAARERARLRVEYVLGQMYRHDMISTEDHGRFVGQPIPFNQGKMYFSLNTIMDLVKEALNEPVIEEAFQNHGIDNVATSGVKIFTSVERDFQEESQKILRKELSRLATRLQGYKRDEVQREYLQLDLNNGGYDFSPGTFHFGRIEEIITGLEPKVAVKLVGAHETMAANIDEKGLMNLLVPLVKYEKQLWSEAGKGDLPMLVNRLRVGDLIYVSVRQPEKGDNDALILDLERYPEVQGAILVLREGMISAMVGGMENRYYNRAISARRPMGSVVKPLVYTAALQLGWNSLDALNNERDVFVYQNKPYFPRPDHLSPYKEVSMSWAGVHSENIATVWLLYHLCDRMTPAQFREVLEYLGLNRLDGESAAGYRRRIRDKYGIMVDDSTVREVAFTRAVRELEPDLIFAGRLSEYETISKLHYGAGFDQYLTRIDIDLGLEIEEEGADVEGIVSRDRDYQRREKEAELRKNVLRRNHLRLKKIRAGLDDLRTLIDSEEQYNKPTYLYHDLETGNYLFLGTPEEAGAKGAREGGKAGGRSPAIKSGPRPVPAGWRPVAWFELSELLNSMDFLEAEVFWSGVLIDNLLAAETVDIISETVEREYRKLRELAPYSPEILHEVRDFKVLVALRYIIGLCRQMGIESKLDPVLSFPLGSNVLSLLEVARAYEGMLTGSVMLNGGEGRPGLAIIEAIEGSDGEVIYRSERAARKVLAPETSLEVTDILRQVIKHGTGRYADRNVRLRSAERTRDQQLSELALHVPVVGKTGTANSFTNAAFAGGIPGLRPGGFFSFPDGYILTSYVGYDDNKPMVRNTTHITGAAGALPIWTDVANQILLKKDYAAGIDLEDLSFSGISEFPLYYSTLGQVQVKIDPERGGLPVGDQAAGVSILSFGEFIDAGQIKPARFFRPYWQVEVN
jgi:membrane peptidoglycan carboxypeptidase